MYTVASPVIKIWITNLLEYIIKAIDILSPKEKYAYFNNIAQVLDDS